MKESINLTLDFNEEFEKMSSTVEIPNSVCDGSNVYTYVPDSGSKSLSPYNVVRYEILCHTLNMR